MADTRILFDGLLLKFGSMYPEISSYISISAGIIFSPIFETGLVKTSRKEALNDDESLAMTVLEKGVQDAVATADFASALLDEARAKNSLYQDVD